MYFGHKHLETGPNCGHKIATFLKYYMPLNMPFKAGKIQKLIFVIYRY